MSSINGLTGQYINTLSNLSFEDDNNTLLYLRLDGSNKMENKIDMDGYKIVNLSNPVNSQDGVNKQFLDLQLLSYVLSNNPVLFANLNMNNFRITSLASPINLSDATTVFYVQTQNNLKLSLTGGNMTGDLNMGSKKITSLATPTNSTDGVNKTYVDSNFLELSGSTMTGNLNMGTKKITNLATPTNGNDGVNKSYVDNNFLEQSGGTISGNLLCQNYVTIGNTAINSYPLEITSTAPNLVTAFTSGYTMTSAGTSSISPTLNSNVSMKTFGSIWSQARLIVSSDPRIKTDFQELEIKESLEIIDKITPFRYTMIENKKIELGFSAKQLQNLIPEAVDTHQNRLPSMMEIIDVKNNVIRTKKRIEAHQDDEIVLFQADREIRTKILKKMSKNYIRVDLPDGEYLFFGHIVNDFLTLDYKQVNIHLLNVVKNLLFRVDCLETIIKKYI